MKIRLCPKVVCSAVLGIMLLFSANVGAQQIVMSKEDVVAFTAEWDGERFPDGRPKVPDSILERMRSVEIEEAWGTLHEKGYTQQFAGDWKRTHLDPGGVLVGRALTTVFMPKRPDIDKLLTEKGHKDGHIGGRNSWPIDMLVPNDVY
ncbi:MAG: RraA family protein, partial [bacterium]